MSVDDEKFLDPVTKRVMRAWRERERGRAPAELPWTPMKRPLSEARVALLSSAGIAPVDGEPFDQQGERDDPWWGDPSFRRLPREVTTDETRLYHLHIDTRPGDKDLDCVLPLRRLDELVEAGEVGSSAAHHYSMMGYILEATELLQQTVPAIADGLASDEVDLFLLVPA